MKGNHKHGAAKKGQPHKTYMVWVAMKKRCNNHNDKRYARYGGRGVTVCEAWASSYEQFAADMGPRPEGASIDRIDNNGNYAPDNCRWATKAEQARNTSRTLWIDIDGVRRCAQDWAAALGVSRQTIYNRLKRGEYCATRV